MTKRIDWKKRAEDLEAEVRRVRAYAFGNGCFGICEMMRCPTCNGRGTVNPLTAPKGFFVAATTTCPTCDGTGESA